ncbi:hypothetical protein FKM82_016372 [Ascaphus truei]
MDGASVWDRACRTFPALSMSRVAERPRQCSSLLPLQIPRPLLRHAIFKCPSTLPRLHKTQTFKDDQGSERVQQKGKNVT